MEDLIEEYQSSLEDLKFNSKPHINMLTILAEENKQHAEYIVHLIEAQITKASEKLPIMYLLDSIVKNVGENYKPLFAKNLNNTFKMSFESADDKSKMSLYKLRTTWDDYFPLRKLHSLDTTIKALDPNWPVKPLPSHLQDGTTTSIHVNPKFIKKDVQQPTSVAAPKVKKSVTRPTVPPTAAQSTEVDKIRQQLVRQQRELLDLQQKKLMLELEQTKQQLEAKQKEAQHTVSKKQDKLPKDPRVVPPSALSGSLKVTVTNAKVSAPVNQKQVASKDPRLKSMSTKKILSNNMATPDNKSNAKVEVSKTSDINEKKKVSKSVSKKDKSISSSDSDMVANKTNLVKSVTSKPQQEKTKENATAGKKMKNKEVGGTNMNEIDRPVKRSYNKPSESLSPPPKVARKSNSPTKFSKDHLPNIRKDRLNLNDPRRPSSIEKKNQRIHELKDRSNDSRSSEGSLSPRFSPEPDTDDSSMVKSTIKSQFEKKNDALRRRPSFDPDLHIPQELTLSHQNEILKQAENQLRSGQLTHGQHQELLKQLHQLFEMQRIRKMQSDVLPPPVDPRMHRSRSRSPLDPRSERKNKSHRQATSEMTRRKPLLDSNFGNSSGEVSSRDHLQDTRFKSLPGNKPLGNRNSRGKVRSATLQRRQVRNQVNEIHKPLASDVRHHNLEASSSHVRHHPGSVRPPHYSSPHLSPPSFLSSLDRSGLTNESEFNMPTRLSPPPFLKTNDDSNHQIKDRSRPFHKEKIKEINADSKHKNLRKFAHGDVHRKHPPRNRNEGSVLTNSNLDAQSILQKSQDNVSVNIKAEEKVGLEEPEDYIIANMPNESTDLGPKLEEPEDYIIAGLDKAKTREIDDSKASCEEPEDFIIAQMPPGAEAYHKHSIGLKRNTDSEKAYLEHMKKIKQSIYSKELKRASKSNKTETSTEKNVTEKVPVEAESVSRKSEETIKSPPLPLKKRRYISSEEAIGQKTDVAPTEEDIATEATVEKNKSSEPVNVLEEKKDEKESQQQILLQSLPDKKTDSLETTSVEEKQKNNENPEAKNKKRPIPKETPIPSQKKSAEPVKRDGTVKSDKEDLSLVYIIEDESPGEPVNKRERKETREPRAGRGRRLGPRHKEWHHEKPSYDDAEEARLQRMMEDEKKQLEWEDNLHRELAMEHWKEERMRRLHRERLGRGGRFPPPDHWESPPRDLREPIPFDIARGELRGRPRGGPPARPLPRRPEDGPLRRVHPYPPVDELRGRHPREDLRGPPLSNENFRGRFSPGWEGRRPRSPPPPPGHRLPPPLPHMHDPRDDRRLEWDRHLDRLPPRDPPFHPDDHRHPTVEHRRFPPEPAKSPPINQLNVNKLLTDLVSMGIIPGSKKEESKPPSPVPEPLKAASSSVPAPDVKAEAVSSAPKSEAEAARSVSPFIDEDLMMLDPDAQIPVVSLTSDLKIRHDEIIKRLYTGIQCSACGLRFTTRQTDLYADHLDWHYRSNRKEKDGSSLTHRELYPTAGEWICYEEIQNPEERSKNPFLDETDNVDNVSSALKTDEDDLTVPLTGQPGEDTCKVCKEAFETFYNEADDEWQFANCVRVDNDNFHPNCYGDHYDLTPLPTPIKTPVFNPLDGTDGIPGLDNVEVKEELSEDAQNVEESTNGLVTSENTPVEDAEEDIPQSYEDSATRVDQSVEAEAPSEPLISDNFADNKEATAAPSLNATSTGDAVNLEDDVIKPSQGEELPTVTETNVAPEETEEVSEEAASVDRDLVSDSNSSKENTATNDSSKSSTDSKDICLAETSVSNKTTNKEEDNNVEVINENLPDVTVSSNADNKPDETSLTKVSE